MGTDSSTPCGTDISARPPRKQRSQQQRRYDDDPAEHDARDGEAVDVCHPGPRLPSRAEVVPAVATEQSIRLHHLRTGRAPFHSLVLLIAHSPSSCGRPTGMPGRNSRNARSSVDLTNALMSHVRGVPVKVVLEIPGHASVSLTYDTYSHVSGDARERFQHRRRARVPSAQLDAEPAHASAGTGRWALCLPH
jgi:hypothetical protein